MPKYLIEGAIDFYSELYKSLDVEENDFKTEEDDNLCLITKQPLTTNYVTMECGHKFNYVPLFKDVDNHKKNFNNMEGTSGKLNKNEIRCPYCRKKQTTLLPYYENMGIPKVMGVNETYVFTYKEPSANNYSYGLCEYVTSISDNIDGSNNYVKKCNLSGSTLYVQTLNTNYGDTKAYCWLHKKVMIRKYKKEILNKMKMDVKIANQKNKEQEKKIKQDEKIKIKEEAKKLKLEEKEKTKSQKKKQIKSENIILGPSDIDIISHEETHQNEGCVSLLKTGPNKGNVCGCTIYNLEAKLCKRHWKNMETKYSDKTDE